MDMYLTRLKEWMQAHPPDYAYEDANSLLEMLYFDYSQRNILDTEEIKEKFCTLDVLLSLPPKLFDDVYLLVCDLCLCYETKAFREGLRVGARLTLELFDQE